MRVVHHLLSDTEWHFGDDVSPEHALAQVFCEENNMSSWYFNHAPCYERAHLHLGFRYGEISVGLGDYVTRRRA